MSDEHDRTTTYVALRQATRVAVDAMLKSDGMWSMNSIKRLKRAWLAALDAVELATKGGYKLCSECGQPVLQKGQQRKHPDD